MFLLETIITEYELFKEVTYFRKIFTVPKDIAWIATDSDGYIYGYESKPTKPHIINNYWASYGDEFYIGQCTFQGNWEDSLMEVE